MHVQKMIELQNISVVYDGALALDGLSLTLKQGEHTALLGPNGSGKSTLLKVIRAESFPVPSEKSKILWYPDGEADSSALAARKLSAKVSIAETELYLRSRWKISGLDLVISGLYDSPILYVQPDEAEISKAMNLAKKLGLTELVQSSIDNLSRTQLLLLLFARASIGEPKLLLLDECLDNLDAHHRKQVLDFLELLAQNTTLVAATHRADNLPGYIKRGLFMENGRIVKDAPLGEAKPLDYSAQSAGNKTDGGRSGEKPLFRVENASVLLKGEPVLKDINWKVYPGEHWTIMGAAGSGKSMLLRLLAGEFYPALGGVIERNMPGHTEPLGSINEIRSHIRLVSGDMNTVYSYSATGEQFVLSGLDGGPVWREAVEGESAQARFWMEKLDALHLAERQVHTLSTGQQRRLVLARALIGAPKVLLLDDPFAGLDPESRAKVIDLLKCLIDTEKIQTIMITRYPEDIIVDSSRVAIMRDGRLTDPSA